MLAKGYTLGLGIDENTAVVVGPAREATVIGYRGALVLDLAGASVDKAQPLFNLSNARISYLDSGDRFKLDTRAYAPGPDKALLTNADREHRAPIFSTDIVGNTSVVDLLEKLADSDQQRAVGIAFEGPGSPAPERGFEFTLTRVPETREYATNREDAYSIYRIRMDVRPVKIAQPFYSAQ
jgi:cyanophycinase